MKPTHEHLGNPQPEHKELEDLHRKYHRAQLEIKPLAEYKDKFETTRTPRTTTPTKTRRC